jgi:hypothetical protein
MRFAAAILILATCFFRGTGCYCQDPCSVRVSPKPGERPLTSAEIVHRMLLQTPPQGRRYFALSDVELILKCGTQQDAEALFAALRNTSVKLDGGTVVDASQSVVRVSRDDGFKPNLAAFRFNFDSPINAIPHPGDKILISGMYSSYSREPFQIDMTNSSFVVLPPRR